MMTEATVEIIPQAEIVVEVSHPAAPVVEISSLGLQGPSGPMGGGIRINQSLAATWIVPHQMNRIPAVQIHLTTGELIQSDVIASETLVTITFGSAQQGFVILS